MDILNNVPCSTSLFNEIYFNFIDNLYVFSLFNHICIIIYIFYLVDKLQRTHNGCDKQILRANAGTLSSNWLDHLEMLKILMGKMRYKNRGILDISTVSL